MSSTTWLKPSDAAGSIAAGFGTGSSGQILTSNGSTASWVAPATSGTVTSVATSNSATALTLSGGPITSTGTLALSYSGTALPIANGGTGQTTKAASFDALQPMTTGGDLIYGGTSGTATRLANGSKGQSLFSYGGTLAPTWGWAGSGSVANWTPSFSGAGWTYGFQYATYGRNTFIDSVALTVGYSSVVVTAYISVTGYPSITTQYITLPFASSSWLGDQHIIGCLANDIGATAIVPMLLTANTSQLSFYGLPTGFALSTYFHLTLNFSYISN